MISEEDGDDAGIAPESSSSLSFSGTSFSVRRTFTKMKIAIIFWLLYSTFLYHKIDLITK